jgi:hypothetical protein
VPGAPGTSHRAEGQRPRLRYHNLSFSSSIAYEGELASAVRLTNIAWSRSVDEIFDTHKFP